MWAITLRVMPQPCYQDTTIAYISIIYSNAGCRILALNISTLRQLCCQAKNMVHKGPIGYHLIYMSNFSGQLCYNPAHSWELIFFCFLKNMLKLNVFKTAQQFEVEPFSFDVNCALKKIADNYKIVKQRLVKKSFVLNRCNLNIKCIKSFCERKIWKD